MKPSALIRTAIIVSATALTTYASAAVLQVNSSGILTGAKNVLVQGKLYNVSFAEGSCISTFTGCDGNSDFTFSNLTSVIAAGDALLNQVFIDNGSNQFNSQTDKIFGCTNTAFCYTFIPYLSNGPASTIFGMAYTANFSSAFLSQFPGENDKVTLSPFQKDIDLANYDVYNFAKFELANTVPEPTSIALMGVAFAGLAFSRRRKS